jgi:hypothetical protein
MKNWQKYHLNLKQIKNVNNFKSSLGNEYFRGDSTFSMKNPRKIPINEDCTGGKITLPLRRI